MRLWGRATSLNVQKVLWLLAELGLEFEHIPAGGKYGRLNDPEFRALNPNGLVPVLEDGELAIWESHTILRYLAALHGPAFWPDDPAERSLADRWMDWMQSTLQPAFLGGLFAGYFRTPEPRRNWQAIRQAQTRTAQLFTMVDRHLAGRDYLAGDAISLAEFTVGTALYRYYALDLERPQLPNVEAWYNRLQERPAYRSQVMTSFEELRGVMP